MSRVSLVLMLIVAAMGCSRFRTDQWDVSFITGDATSKKAGAFEVQVDGSNLTFHAPQVAASKTRNYLPRLRQLLKANEQAAARELVYRSPELALETLRGDAWVDGRSDPAVVFVAHEYDRWLKLPASQGWVYAHAQSQRESSVRNYLTARSRILESLSTGGASESDVQELPRLADATRLDLVRIDAARTAATAHLVGLRAPQAAALLAAACEGPAKIDPYQRSQLLLLHSDALRRSQQIREADQVWTRAVKTAGALTRESPPLFDPAFWDTASYLRPVALEWPAEVVSEIAPLSPLPTKRMGLQSVERESLVWSAIGQALLDRGDHEATLVALKRAEAASQDQRVQGWCRVSEANALARVGQTSTATALLAGQLNSSDRTLASAVAASLGSLKCQSGDVEAGRRLLLKAFESDSLEDWPGLADAEADLGLACLVQGDEAEGLRWLHAARDRYEIRGETTRLKQTLVNEREYWRHRKEASRASELDARIKSIDSPNR